MSKHIPVATYRLQLNRAFGFDSAGEVADYLKQLGVSHVYASPYFKAVRGSLHGYNIVDHHQINPELGGEEGRARFCKTLQNLKMSQVLDVVPNHMAVADPQNRLWWDVLRNGRHSRYADFFDIDWDVCDPKRRNKVVLPVLGDHYHRCLEAGEISLGRDEEEIVVRYHEHVLPVSPRSLSLIVLLAATRHRLETLSRLVGRLNPLSNGTAGTQDLGRVEAGLTDLKCLLAADPLAQRAVEDVVDEISADRDRMDLFLSRQHYCLAYWRTAGNDINYRRFFDINELAGMRVESREVFAFTHQRVLHWIQQGCLDGLRIDHPDGLRDPLQYLRRLRRAAPDRWIVVEKILESEETLPQAWPVAGTTGYDFLNQVNGLFVDPSSEAAMTALYREFTGECDDYRAVVHRKKHQILDQSFGSEIDRLTGLLVDVRSRGRSGRDYTRREIRQALQELLASFPVYRTYIRPSSGRVDEHDRQMVQAAVGRARRHCPHLGPGIWQFLQDILLLHLRGKPEEEFILRFQQLSGPAMAKGVEDTAFYCFNRLISLNEVGGDPGRFGVSSAAFHQFCSYIQRHWPQTMLSTSTHDTKRGEDTRLRINLLSEIPQRWAEALGRWVQMNTPFRIEDCLDAGSEYVLYQTLVGAWPIGPDRLWPYMQKAAKEAKVHTSWVEPDTRYEQALKAFVEGVLANEEFIRDLESFLEPLIEPARISSLSQTLIKCTAPGIPDFYQGCELWNHSLVDPDNRRPVDFDRRRRLLAELEKSSPARVCDLLDQGLPKMLVIHSALNLRRRHPELFGPHGTYRPLYARGSKADHLVAFVRGEGMLTVAARLLIGLAGNWKDTRIDLPPGRWTNMFTGESWNEGTQPLSDLLNRFPVGLFLKERAIS